jgi:hypothetical protein
MSVWLVDDSDDEQAATSARPYRRISALSFPTRHLGPVQMTIYTALGVTKRVMDCDSFFLPTIFPRPADCATRGTNGSACGDSIRFFVTHTKCLCQGGC